MEIEFTARQVRITKPLRELAETAMERIGKLLGKTAHATITLYAERHLQIAEITLKLRQQTLVAAGRSEKMDAALREAIEHIEHQAKRHQERQRDRKRLPKEETVLLAPPVSRQKVRPSINAELARDSEETEPARRKKKSTAAIPVHSFPQRRKLIEAHIVHTSEAISLRPLTIEQAVKETEFRDRDLLIFRTAIGELYVLHRRRDGQMEIVDISDISESS